MSDSKQGLTPQALSRKIKLLGWRTTPDHCREGIRVTRSPVKGEVGVVAQYDEEPFALRQAAKITKALEGEGFVVHRSGVSLRVSRKQI